MNVSYLPLLPHSLLLSLTLLTLSHPRAFAQAPGDAADGVFALVGSGDRTAANREFMGQTEMYGIHGPMPDTARPKVFDWNGNNRYGDDGVLWVGLQTTPSPGRLFLPGDLDNSSQDGYGIACASELTENFQGITTRTRNYANNTPGVRTNRFYIQHLVNRPSYVGFFLRHFQNNLNTNNGVRNEHPYAFPARLDCAAGESRRHPVVVHPVQPAGQPLQTNNIGNIFTCGSFQQNPSFPVEFQRGPKELGLMKITLTEQSVFSLGIGCLYNGNNDWAPRQIDIRRLASPTTDPTGTVVATTGRIPERSDGAPSETDIGTFGLGIFWFGFSNAPAGTYVIQTHKYSTNANWYGTDIDQTDGFHSFSALFFEPGVGPNGGSTSTTAGTSTASGTSAGASSGGSSSGGAATAAGSTSGGGGATGGATGDTAGGATAGSTTDGGATAGSVTAGGTGSGTTTAGSSTGPVNTGWVIILKKPKLTKPVKFRGGTKVSGTITAIGEPPKSVLRVQAGLSLTSSNFTFTPVTKVRKLNKRSQAKFKAKGIGAAVPVVGGQTFFIRVEATDERGFEAARAQVTAGPFTAK